LQYDQNEKILTVKREGRLITFRPQQIAIAKLEDKNEARLIVEELKEIVNETYANRDHIKPIYHTRSMPRPLDIYTLLPGNNCKECGELTCLAFALNLVNEKVKLSQCPLLFKKEFEVNRSKLKEFLPDSVTYELEKTYLVYKPFLPLILLLNALFEVTSPTTNP
jgi:ArsR family metal-binding transcriptional regulator